MIEFVTHRLVLSVLLSCSLFCSYYFLLYSKADLTLNMSQFEIMLTIFSILVACASMLYMTIYWVFFLPENEIIFDVGFIGVLVSSNIWSLLLYNYEKHTVLKYLTTLSLFMVADFAILICVESFRTSLASFYAPSVLFAFHTTFIDGFLWNYHFWS